MDARRWAQRNCVFDTAGKTSGFTKRTRRNYHLREGKTAAERSKNKERVARVYQFVAPKPFARSHSTRASQRGREGPARHTLLSNSGNSRRRRNPDKLQITAARTRPPAIHNTHEAASKMARFAQAIFPQQAHVVCKVQRAQKNNF